jgi:hypothetical protein
MKVCGQWSERAGSRRLQRERPGADGWLSEDSGLVGSTGQPTDAYFWRTTGVTVTALAADEILAMDNPVSRVCGCRRCAGA